MHKPIIGDAASEVVEGLGLDALPKPVNIPALDELRHELVVTEKGGDLLDAVLDYARHGALAEAGNKQHPFGRVKSAMRQAACEEITKIDCAAAVGFERLNF